MMNGVERAAHDADPASPPGAARFAHALCDLVVAVSGV